MATKKKNTNKKVVKPAKQSKPTSAKKVAKKVAAVQKKSKSVIVKKKAAPVKKKVVPAKPAKKTVIKKAKPALKKVATKKSVKPAKKVVAENKKKVIKKVVKPVKQSKPKPVKKAAPVKPVVKVAAKEVAVKTVPKKAVTVGIKKPAKQKEPLVKEVKVPKTSVKTSKPYTPDYEPLENRQTAENDSEPTLRYSDAELEEFRVLINKKLADAMREVAYLQNAITRKDDGEDTEGRYATLEDGSSSMEREHLSQMLSRQITFIDNLKKALIRIENKTYGICRVTGKLIDKARLRAVPHATLSMEAKLGLAQSKE